MLQPLIILSQSNLPKANHTLPPLHNACSTGPEDMKDSLKEQHRHYRMVSLELVLYIPILLQKGHNAG